MGSRTADFASRGKGWLLRLLAVLLATTFVGTSVWEFWLGDLLVPDLHGGEPMPNRWLDVISTTAFAVAAAAGPLWLAFRGFVRGQAAAEMARQQAQIIDQVHDTIIAVDLDRRITRWNKGAERMYGYSAEEALGRHVSFIFSPEDWRANEERLIPALLDAGHVEGDSRGVRKSGEVFDKHVSVSVVNGADGRPNGILCLSTDVSAQRKTEIFLRESEERYRTLVESTPEAIVVHDDGDIRYANRAAAELFGIASPEEMIGTYLFGLFHPDYLAFTRARARRMLDGETLEPAEIKVVRSDGAILDVEARGRAFATNGGTMILTLLRDITDRKRAEERLRIRNQEMETLHTISTISLKAQTLHEALQEIVRVIASSTEFPIVSVELLDRSRMRVASRDATGLPSPHANGGGVPLDETFAGFVVRSGRPVIELHAGDQPKYSKALQHRRIETIVSVPMTVGGEVIGALTLAHPDKIDLDDRVPAWAEALANYLAELTERMRTEEALRRRIDIFNALHARIWEAGTDRLLDDELLELLLLFATPRGDVQDLTKRLLGRFASFSGVINAEPRALCEVEEAGTAAPAFQAIREAATRLAREEVIKRPVFDSWKKLIDYCRTSMAHESAERFRILYLNRKNMLIADEQQQKGTIDQTQVYPREVVKRALELGATAMIMVHNHPSGDPTPSTADIEITRQVRDAALPLGIVLHDHVIVSRSGYNSFRTMQLL